MADEKQNPPAAAADAKAAPAPEAKKDGEKGEHKEAPAAATPKTAPAQSPWLPVLVVMIILPVLSFLMTEYVMVPRVKKALGDITKIQEEAKQPAAGGPLPAEKKEGKKAGGKEGKEGGKEEAGGIKFDNVVANLSGSMKSRFLKVSFAIEGDDENFKAEIEPNRTKIIDSALGILGALTVAELDEAGTKNIVRSDLIDGFNQVLGKPLVKRLYFSEFVIQ